LKLDDLNYSNERIYHNEYLLVTNGFVQIWKVGRVTEMVYGFAAHLFAALKIIKVNNLLGINIATTIAIPNPTLPTMFAIRDSQEPEDPLEDSDIFPVSPIVPTIDQTPISFDLPSTTSLATQPPFSTSIPLKSPKPPSPQRPNPPTDAEQSMMMQDTTVFGSFLVRHPHARHDDQRPLWGETANNAIEVEESPVAQKSTRRNSLSVVSEGTRQSPIIKNVSRKRRTSRRIEESDTEEGCQGR
jgi:hypothetical protein